MTAYLRVTKTFSFEMAHQLYNYNGACKNIHGHSYSLYVTVGGKPLELPQDPGDGMIIDFSELKKIVNEKIIQRFDHSLVLNYHTPENDVEKLKSLTEKIILVPFQPTCENLTSFFVEIICKHLPSSVKLLKLKLCETATSYCEWNYEDNK